MELTRIHLAASYAARVEQLEREYVNHQILQAEIRQNPDLTGDAETEALDTSAAQVAIIENAHQAALGLLADAEAAKPDPPADAPEVPA